MIKMDENAKEDESGRQHRLHQTIFKEFECILLHIVTHISFDTFEALLRFSIQLVKTTNWLLGISWSDVRA